jgi:hypothetical protein
MGWVYRAESRKSLAEHSTSKPDPCFPQAGWLTSFWGESETNRRAKFYSLTKAGKKQLHTASERWERISLAMATALRTT